MSTPHAFEPFASVLCQKDRLLRSSTRLYTSNLDGDVNDALPLTSTMKSSQLGRDCLVGFHPLGCFTPCSFSSRSPLPAASSSISKPRSSASYYSTRNSPSSSQALDLASGPGTRTREHVVKQRITVRQSGSYSGKFKRAHAQYSVLICILIRTRTSLSTRRRRPTR